MGGSPAAVGLEVGRARIGSLWAALAVFVAVLATIPACSRSQEAKVRDAIAARFHDGMRRCIPLPDAVVGIHVRPPQGGIIWYPGQGPTSPLRHMFVFYAAADDTPVPDLVAELASQGVLKKHVVEAITDVPSQHMAPETHGTDYSHERGTMRVGIYETAQASPDFSYEGQLPGVFGKTSFPSRIDETPLPPANSNYTVPLTSPYVLSMVAGACLLETIEQVVSVETKPFWTGVLFVQAILLLKPNPPAWMKGTTFSRAAIGPYTPSLTEPRRASILLRIEDDKLIYVREGQL